MQPAHPVNQIPMSQMPVIMLVMDPSQMTNNVNSYSSYHPQQMMNPLKQQVSLKLQQLNDDDEELEIAELKVEKAKEKLEKVIKKR